MNICFTLCSNNYLAQALVMLTSFKEHHPGIKCIVGLVDQADDSIDYLAFNIDILPVEELNIPDFDFLQVKYDIIELNTTVKPFYFKYFFENYKSGKVIYLDPDIKIYSEFTEVLNLLDTYNIVITPQNCTPIDDGHLPSDKDLLGTGTFNLGFIALSNYNKVSDFLNWWQKRLVKYGFAKTDQNMFFDQLWINLVPAFFDNYHILKHFGYNTAPSNLHERAISVSDTNCYIINETEPLRFYHFSGYKSSNPGLLCSYTERFNFENRQDVVKIYEDYRNDLSGFRIENFSKIKPKFGHVRKSDKKSFLVMFIKKIAYYIINKL